MEWDTPLLKQELKEKYCKAINIFIQLKHFKYKVNLFGTFKFNFCLIGMLWYFKWQLIIKNISALSGSNKLERMSIFLQRR